MTFSTDSLYNDKIMKYAIIAIIFYLLLFGNISAETIQIKPLKGATVSIPTNVYFVTTGPRYMNKTALRVSFIAEEIYPSVYVEVITYGDTEGDPDIITASYWLSGSDIAKGFNYNSKYGYEDLTNLEFKSWLKWNEFTLTERHNKFLIKYNADKKFIITIIK